MSVFFSSLELEQLRSEGARRLPSDIHTLEWFAKNDIPLFFWGAGGFGRFLATFFTAYGGTVLGFFDNNPAVWGRLALNGAADTIPVHKPDTARFTLSLHPEARLLLAISTCDGQVEVARQADRLGLQFEPFVAPYFYNALAVDNPEPERVYGWLEDEPSRSVYKTLVRRASGLEPDADLPFEPDQYFPEFMPREVYRAFLDVGALNGDTFSRYLTRFGDDFDAYYAVEPNPESLRRFHRREHPKLRLFEVAASDRTGSVRMIAEQSMSRIADDGGFAARAETLDNLLAGNKVTFIKMDVESWEPFALRGAAQLIRRQRPALAISIYHQPAHLWELPVLIKELCPDYHLAIRQHSRFMTETICYALP